MLDGFKFCNHCGKSIGIAAAAPETALAPVKPDLPAPAEDEKPLWETEEDEEYGVEEEDVRPDFSAGKFFIFEVLCRIPVLNFFLLAVMASSRHESVMREYARGKLLATMTVMLIFLCAALTVVLLMVFEIIDPIYLGRWR
jgi:hypothetical protein